MAWITRAEIRGPVGTFDAVTAVDRPYGSGATATIGGTPAFRTVTIGVPEGRPGIPGVNAVENDTAIAAYAATEGTETELVLREKIERRVTVQRPSMAPIMACLRGGQRSCAIQIVSDSTSNDTNDWPTLLAEMIAAEFPDYTVLRRLWNDTAQEYAPATVMQMGPEGVRFLDGTQGSTPRVLPPSASPHLSGVIDVRVKVSLPSWTPASTQTLLGHSGNAGSRGWSIQITNTNLIVFAYSVDGTNLGSLYATIGPGLPVDTPIWVRTLFNPTGGAGGVGIATHSYSLDEQANWTTIGSREALTPLSLKDNSATVGYEVGGVNAGKAGLAKIYEVQIRNGENGPMVAPVLPDLWGTWGGSTLPVPAVGSPILTLVVGSRAGEGMAYLGDAARLKKLTPNYGQLVAFPVSSHNEPRSLVGAGAAEAYDAWFKDVEENLPGVPVVVVTQNPEKPWANSEAHSLRRLDLLGLGPATRRDVIDAAAAFYDYGDWQTDLMLDEVHPNAAGSLVWAERMYEHFI